MARNLLTDREIRNAKPRDKDYRLCDGDGLFVLVASTGGKSFQYRYKLRGKPDTITLKEADSLADARVRVQPLRDLVAAGEDPKLARRVERANKAAAHAQTFKVVKEAWMTAEARRKKWTDRYCDEVRRSMKHLRDLDDLPVSSILAKITAPIIQHIEISAPAMEEKISRRLNAIMDYAVEIGALAQNPLPRRRRAKVERKHYPAVTDLDGVGQILRAARAADPCKGVQRGHDLLVYTQLRVSEGIGGKWNEFELDGADVPVGDGHHKKRDPNAGNWYVPRERMKRKDKDRGPHVVPLPPVLLQKLREWRKADGDGAIYVCPAPRDPEKPITAEAMEKHYRNVLGLGGKHSPHSWRSAFSTICRDAGKDGDAVEAQLDHVVGNKVSAAYDRARRLEIRRDLLAWYEAMLIAARDGAKVTPITRSKTVA